jgi:hypothetical protein
MVRRWGIGYMIEQEWLPHIQVSDISELIPIAPAKEATLDDRKQSFRFILIEGGDVMPIGKGIIAISWRASLTRCLEPAASSQ